MMKCFMLLFMTLAFCPSVQAVDKEKKPTCGLTIITHGFQSPWPIGNGALPGWVRKMAEAIQERIGSSIPIYRIRYDKATDKVLIQDGHDDIDLEQNGGAIILLDWVGVSNETEDYPAQTVADKFFDWLFKEPHKGHNLAEIPIHFIGHSRGCSLNARMVYKLAEKGVLVDQVTTLDPHPSRPWHVPPGNDLVPKTYINVLFADNYYQLNDFPEGMEIDGAFNQDLSKVLKGIKPAEEHMHVHTYYHGTIDTNVGPDTDIDHDHIVTAWYDGTLPRDETGYNFSRFTNTLLARKLSGVNRFISGAEGEGSRESVDSPQQLWSNAGFDQRSTVPSLVTVGQPIEIPYYFADRNSQQTITFYTDTDTNPFNEGFTQIGLENQNSRPAGSIGTAIFKWIPTAADAEKKYFMVKGANASGYARYDYYLKQIEVQSAPTPIPTITFVSPATLLTSSTTQLIKIYGSNFLPPSDPNASKLVFYDPENISYPRIPTYISSGELRYDITVLATGTWKVKVVNGSTESLPFSFTVASGGVQLTGLSISGPSAIPENNNGQFTATAYFSDGSQQTVTSSAIWGENSSATTISSSGLLSAGSVSSDTPVTVTASYTSGRITKSANANVTIVNSASCGDNTKNVVLNGGFELGNIYWNANTLSGGTSGSAGILQGSYPRPGGTWYAYVGDQTRTSFNAVGSLHQTITIPADATSIVLNFYLNIVSDEPSATTTFDKMDVNLRTPSDRLIKKLRTFSEADRGVNTPGYYSPFSIDLTADLAAYKGQNVILQFYVDTDSSSYTIFRIDDVSVVATVPGSVTPIYLAVLGPTNVPENGTAQYNAWVINCDRTIQPVTPTWKENSSVTTISSLGLLTAGSVSSDTPVIITATYGALTVNYPITVVNSAASFSNLAISGPSSMNENSSRQFTATAIFSDGTLRSVTPSWAVYPSAVASISSGGLLTVGAVNSDSTVTVSATYTIDGVMYKATQDVRIIDTPAPPTLTSLTISGANTVNENSTAQYSATASFSYGSSQIVTPAWSVDSEAATVSIFGLLSAREVTNDTSVMISASYTSGGITRNAQKSVTVINTYIKPDDVTAIINSISPSSATQGTSVNFSGTGSDSLGHSITAYSWRSSIDDIIGTSASFGKSNLSVGSHNMYLKVQCSNGTWSPEIPWSGNPLVITPIPTPTPTTTTPKISGGAYHSMTLKSNGSVWAWGLNEYTQLGDGTNTNSSTPIQVSGLSGVITIDGGWGHNLALKLDGTVWAWGGNWSGQLGDGTKINRSAPVQVTSLTSIDVIDAGDSHSLALKSDGTVYVWGRNNYGQLGDGSTTDKSTPVQMTSLSNVKAIAGGGVTVLH